MKSLAAGLLFLCLSQSGALAEKPTVPRYVGEWSDGRGNILLVTESKLRVGSRTASYKEIFRSSDLRFFRFRITSGGRLGGIDGRYFSAEVSREEMRMREYRTLQDCLDDKRVVAVVSWVRDR